MSARRILLRRHDVEVTATSELVIKLERALAVLTVSKRPRSNDGRGICPMLDPRRHRIPRWLTWNYT